MKNYQQSVFTTFNMHNVLYFYKEFMESHCNLTFKKTLISSRVGAPTPYLVYIN